MTPRVSVVMPVYNGERFIAEAVTSVLASRFTDLELLVLDDGSTDASVAEVLRVSAGDARVRVIALPHGGVALARNAGLMHARGEFIANLDADDAMLPRRLERQVEYLDRHPDCVAAGSRALVVDGRGNPVRIGVRLFTHEEIDRAHMDGRGGAIWNPTATFRKAAAMQVGAYTEQLHTTGEDHDLWLRMAEVGRLVNIPEVLTRYRIHDANVSLVKAEQAQRLAVTMGTLARAFARRGITDSSPAKGKAPPMTRAERLRDAALLRHFSGDRVGAITRGLAALALSPGAPATRSALRTILEGYPQ
jgi:glycosyltransferase involved in cell wall biosynthesis